MQKVIFFIGQIQEDSEIIVLGNGLPQKGSRKLKIEYIRESDYENIVKEINQYCTYVGIEKNEYNEDFIITYKYNNLIIKLDKSEDDIRGGILEIIMGDFPW